MHLYYFLKQISDLGLFVVIKKPSSSLGALSIKFGDGVHHWELFVTPEMVADEQAFDNFLTQHIPDILERFRNEKT